MKVKDGKIKLQKFLQNAGVASRRKCDEFIIKGKIFVNSIVGQIGQTINPDEDFVTLNGKQIQTSKSEKKIYLMLYKPRGYITTLIDEKGRKCITELIKDIPDRVYPIGRLDKDSEGLLLLTNNGDFANKVMHPSGNIPKTYRVTVRPKVIKDQLENLINGIEIDGKKTLPANIKIISQERDKSIFQIIIFEGRNRQIRKMCKAVGLSIARLKRTAIGELKLGMLPVGKYRNLSDQEIESLA